MKTAWYLGHRQDQVSDRAILIGDPDRVDRIADHMSDVVHLPVKRGLKTITGSYDGATITIAAFGMGSPIATIVLHELADLGVTHFLRIGTAIFFSPAEAGGFIISKDALSYEGTSASYGGTGRTSADPGLMKKLLATAGQTGAGAQSGLFATFDAFYRDMFAIDAAGRARAAENRRKLSAQGVIAADMETSALLTAADALGVACASLCLGTVDAITLKKLEAGALAKGEKEMFDIALRAMAAS